MKNHTKNILAYGTSYKTLTGAKPLRIRFDEGDGFTGICKGTRYLEVIFGGEKYYFMYKSIRYLIGLKSGTTYFFSHNDVKIKFNLHDSLLLEKTMTFCNVIIHIKSPWNKDQSRHYCDIFLEKCSYQLPKNNYNK